MPQLVGDHRWLAKDNLNDGSIQNIQSQLGLYPSAGTSGPASSVAAGTSYRFTTTSNVAIAATETLIAAVPILPSNTANVAAGSNTLRVGSTVRATVIGTYTSAGAQTATFTWRAGTAGTVAGDTSLATASITSAASGSAIVFRAQLEFVVQTLGTGTNGTFAGDAFVINAGTTGISTTIANAPVAVSTSSGNFPTATFLDLTMLAGTSNSASITASLIEIIV